MPQVKSLHFLSAVEVRTAPRLGKRKRTPPCSSAELFFAEKNGAHRGKISAVDMAFLGFYRVFVSTTGLESFSVRPSPKDFLSVVVVTLFFFSARSRKHKGRPSSSENLCLCHGLHGKDHSQPRKKSTKIMRDVWVKREKAHKHKEIP